MRGHNRWRTRLRRAEGAVGLPRRDGPQARCRCPQRLKGTTPVLVVLSRARRIELPGAGERLSIWRPVRLRAYRRLNQENRERRPNKSAGYRDPTNSVAPDRRKSNGRRRVLPIPGSLGRVKDRIRPIGSETLQPEREKVSGLDVVHLRHDGVEVVERRQHQARERVVNGRTRAGVPGRRNAPASGQSPRRKTACTTAAT